MEKLAENLDEEECQKFYRPKTLFFTFFFIDDFN